MEDNDVAPDLIWYFGPAQTIFSRSRTGEILDRARDLAYDSSGARIPATALGVTARPTSVGRRPEPSQGPDHNVLARFGRISRALRRSGPDARRYLTAYYGPDGDAAVGAGPSGWRLLVLYRWTAAWAKLGFGAEKDVKHRVQVLASQSRTEELIVLEQAATKLLEAAVAMYRRANQ